MKYVPSVTGRVTGYGPNMQAIKKRRQQAKMQTKTKETQTPKIGWAMAAEVLRKMIPAKCNVMFTGAPGIGKTALIKTITKELGHDLIIFHPVISDPTDFKGMPWMFKDDKGKEHCVFVPFDQLEALINATSPVVCFLDDLGQAPDAVQAAAMQLLHGGTLNGKSISKHVTFVACTNRKQDRAGVSGILEPVKSRFVGIWELVPEIEPFIQFLINEKHSPVLVAFMRHRPNWLVGGDDGWKPAADIVNQACPRTIEHLGKTIRMGFDKITSATVYAGAVGKAMGNEFFSFEQLATRLPDIDVVLANPNGAEAPKDQEACYAMIGALHSRMDRGNLGNIYKYIRAHFSKEMQAVFHWDVEHYNKNLIQHESYIGWAKDHGDMLTN